MSLTVLNFTLHHCFPLSFFLSNRDTPPLPRLCWNGNRYDWAEIFRDVGPTLSNSWAAFTPNFVNSVSILSSWGQLSETEQSQPTTADPPKLFTCHQPVQKWRAHLDRASTVLRTKCSSNPQYEFRSQAQIFFSHDCTGYYLGGKFSAGTAISERMSDVIPKAQFGSAALSTAVCILLLLAKKIG